MARQLIKGGDVITEVRAARSVGLCANLYSRLNFNDKDDLTFVKELDDYRAAVTVLERCVRLQNAEVLSQKNIAIVEIAKALRPRRERIARQIAEAFMALRAALAEEQSFGEELATQDAGFAHQMRPAIFPMLLLSDAEILSWIGEAQAAGLMDPGYQHLETAEDAVEASA